VAAGDYGTFAGANKPGLVTIREQPGASATMRVSFSGANNIAIDGLTIAGATLSGSTRNVTIRNSTFTSHTQITGLANANVLFDHDSFNNINSPGQFDRPARIHLAYSSPTPSGVTIANSVLAGGDSDGVQSGVGVNIIDNEFRDILASGPNHTDAIQLLDAPGAVVRGNYIRNSTSGIVAYDGLTRALIERNVIDLTTSNKRPWAIEIYSDNSSIVRHNTLRYGACAYNLPCGQLDIGRKDQDDAGFGTVVTDNVATQINSVNGSVLAERHHNLVRQGAGPGDLTGIPAFTGGAGPTTYDGYHLSAGSPGKNAASDGTDAGI
jgi:hypothetical protein